MKTTIFTLLFALTVSVANAADEVKIEKTNNLKFLVSVPAGSKFTAIVLDADNNVIHTEFLVKRKSFDFSNLVDGNYKLKVVDSTRHTIEAKDFAINTEVKRDLVTIK